MRVIFLPHRRQQPHETLDEYLSALKTLSKDCNFQSVTAAQYREESIRDDFITSLQSPLISQRLLENKTLDLNTMFDQACALESAIRTYESYTVPSPSVNLAVPPTPALAAEQDQPDPNALAAVESKASSGFFCVTRLFKVSSS